MSETRSDRREIVAVHASSDEQQLVAMVLRVLILPVSEGGFYAQALEVDYAASGSTIEEAQRNFERGLELTVRANLDRHGNIERLFARKTPLVYWEQYASALNQYELIHVCLHDSNGALDRLPFKAMEILPVRDLLAA